MKRWVQKREAQKANNIYAKLFGADCIFMHFEIVMPLKERQGGDHFEKKSIEKPYYISLMGEKNSLFSFLCNVSIFANLIVGDRKQTTYAYFPFSLTTTSHQVLCYSNVRFQLIFPRVDCPFVQCLPRPLKRLTTSFHRHLFVDPPAMVDYADVHSHILQNLSRRI